MRFFQKFLKANIIEKIILCLLVVLFVYIAFYRLGKPPLENWDEAFYADVTRTMLRTGDFIAMKWNRIPFIDKPPLYMWFSSLASVVFGMNEFAFRIISALSTVIIAIIILGYSYAQYGILPALLASSTLILNDVFIWRARSGNTDLLATLFIVISYFMIIGKNKYKYPILGLLFALIYLTKASLVLYPLLVFGIIELIYERSQLVKHMKQYVITAVIFMVLVGLWLFIGYEKIGPYFVNYFLFKSDQGNAKIALSNASNMFIMYAYYSFQRRFFYVFLFGLATILITRLKEKKYGALFLFSTLLITQLSLSKTTNNWYLIPSIPFWSLTTAFATYTILKIFQKNKLLFVGVFAGIAVIGFYISYKTFRVNITPIFTNYAMVNQTQTCKKLKDISLYDDTVIRLDHLYPSTIYYADRRVYSSPRDHEYTSGMFIGRTDLVNDLRSKKYKWVIGTTSEVDDFLKKFTSDISYEIVKVNDGEKIIHVK